MADELPKPEPKEIDEKLSLELRHLAEDVILRARPNEANAATTASTISTRTRSSAIAGTRSSVSWSEQLVVPVVGGDPAGVRGAVDRRRRRPAGGRLGDGGGPGE